MLKGKKILVIDDSKTIRLQIKTILKSEGVNVVEAGSEWGMFSKIDEYGTVADLVIMDITLNQDNGLELIEKLKARQDFMNIPVIIITENPEISTVLKAKELGVKSYIKKPITKDELVSRINSCLTQSSSDNKVHDQLLQTP
jgi:DNA-binding response OmpR family regulator